jgi:hypothetical protein
MNRVTNRITAALAGLTFLALPAELSWATQAVQPDATIDYTGGSIAFIVGYNGGHGVLHYKGMDYRFTVNGLSAGDVGASGFSATGKVYHLNKAQDFPGNYVAFAAGATFGAGVSGASMRNQNGVTMEIIAVNAGAQLTLASSGIAVTFDGPPTPTVQTSSAAK